MPAQDTINLNPEYRNPRANYYSDKFYDTTEIGSIITTLKVQDNDPNYQSSYDLKYLPDPAATSNDGGSLAPYRDKFNDNPSRIDTHPEYQYKGYLYCDGGLYYIEDYPLLFQAIGNDYGGIARPGAQLLQSPTYNGDGVNTLLFFDNPPNYDPENPLDSGTPISMNVVTQDNGDGTFIITEVIIINPGSGYDPLNEPNYYLTDDQGTQIGIASGLLNISMLFDADGSLANVSPDNVFQLMGAGNLGTFAVPDLKARKIVGYGPVYGANTPTIGLISESLGYDSLGGVWLLTKDVQQGLFSLGSLTTVGYTNVTDTTSTTVSGQQEIKVNLKEKRVPGVPEHSHFAYHTVPGNVIESMPSYSGDRYLAEYKSATGALSQFFPVGGVSFEHNHCLLKQPLPDNTVATYDIFDYVPGANLTSGSIKYESDGQEYYYASGSAAAGTYELVTFIPVTTFKTMDETSKIGGRTGFIGGEPLIEYNLLYEYTSPQSTTLALPAQWEKMIMTVAGGGGSGGNGTQNGNSGTGSSVSVGSELTVDCGGGGGGGAGNGSQSGGDGGTVSITGSASANVSVLSNKSASGGSGSGNTQYISNQPNDPGTGGEGGDNTGTTATNDGTDGINTFVSDTGYNFSSGTQSGSGNINITTSYKITAITFTLAGARGGNSSPCGTQGGSGSVLTLGVNSPTSGFQGSYACGVKGVNVNGGSGGYNANGAQSGRPNGGGSWGGGGGGASAIKNNGGSIVAGAGGGGGAGGWDSGYNDCGDPGQPNNTPGWSSNTPLATTGNLFSGAGKRGGNAGCNGGGGGGGGGGVATSSYTISGGGYGGGGGGAAGHGGGYGGGRGMTSYKTSVFSNNGHSDTNRGDGYISWTWSEDRSYWTGGGGGGGAGGFATVLVDRDLITSATSLAINVGNKGAGISGVAAGGGAFVTVGFGEVVGWIGGETTLIEDPLLIAGSEDVDVYTSGTGIGTAGGFKLPETQVPEVEFLAGGGGGDGAAATVQIANGKVTGITKTNGGAGYGDAPRVRIKHGAGTKAYATATVNAAGEVEDVNLSTLITPEAYTHYVKFKGGNTERFVVLSEMDCTNVTKFIIKACRGNGVNGGEQPENGGDELKVYYNTDLSLSAWTAIDVLVPFDDISEAIDGGSGDTQWYWYEVNLPEGARVPNVRIKLSQDRNPNLAESSQDADHYGICDFIYEYQEITELQFIPASGAIPTSADQLTYVVKGDPRSIYPSGLLGLDARFTLQSTNPILPEASLDPDWPVPVIEPYHAVKYLIKAF